jgi:hypothetical protein
VLPGLPGAASIETSRAPDMICREKPEAFAAAVVELIKT